MTDTASGEISLTIRPETAEEEAAIERLHARTFGPGRYARTAFRLREGAPTIRSLSFTARIGTLLVGSVRLSPILIGAERALLLGPLTVEPPFRSRGIGARLIAAALEAARAEGHRLVLLVGDEPYYGRMGFKKVSRARVRLPGPVDPDRVLVAELVEGALAAAEGDVRADRRYPA